MFKKIGNFLEKHSVIFAFVVIPIILIMFFLITLLSIRLSQNKVNKDSGSSKPTTEASTSQQVSDPAVTQPPEDIPDAKIYIGDSLYLTYGSEEEAQKAVASEKNRFTIPTYLAENFVVKAEPNEKTARIFIRVCMVDSEPVSESKIAISSQNGWTEKLDISDFYGHQITLSIKAEDPFGINYGFSYISLFVPEKPVPEKKPEVTTSPQETEPPVTTVTTPTTRPPQSTTTPPTTTKPSTTKPSTTSKPSTTKPHSSTVTTTKEPEETEYVDDDEPVETEYVDDETDGDIPVIDVHDCDCNCYWCVVYGNCYHCLYTDYYLCSCS